MDSARSRRRDRPRGRHHRSATRENRACSVEKISTMGAPHERNVLAQSERRCRPWERHTCEGRACSVRKKTSAKRSATREGRAYSVGRLKKKRLGSEGARRQVLPGPSNLCLFGLVLVWQSRELGHELVVIILREADMKCLKLLLTNVDHTCALQEVVGAGGQLIWCRLGGRHKAGQAPRRERPFVLHRRLVQPRGCRLEAQAPIAWN